MRFLRIGPQFLTFATRLAILVVCVCAVIAGSWCLADYSNRPGPTGKVANDLNLVLTTCEFPAGHVADDGRRSLILFYHPHCPCTKATVRCLQRIFTRFVERPEFIAVAYCPDNEDDSWIESSITSTLQSFDQSRIIIDRDGKFCRRFGVCTSGHAVVYDDAGQLIFSGGLTPGRGHEGHCQAVTDLLNKVNGRSGELVFWPVYGCQIVATEARP